MREKPHGTSADVVLALERFQPSTLTSVDDLFHVTFRACVMYAADDSDIAVWVRMHDLGNGRDQGENAGGKNS